MGGFSKTNAHMIWKFAVSTISTRLIPFARRPHKRRGKMYLLTYNA